METASQLQEIRALQMDSTIESVQPEYSDDGVDLTLIRWMQSLTPRERLEFLQDQADSLTALREKFNAPISGNPEDAGPAQG